MNKSAKIDTAALSSQSASISYQKATFAFFGVMLIVNALAPRFWGVGMPVFGLLFFALYPLAFKSWSIIPKQFAFFGALLIGLICASSLWSAFPDAVWDRAGSLGPILLGCGLFLSVALSLDIKAPKDAGLALIISFSIGLTIVLINFYSEMSIYKLLKGLSQDENILFHVMNRPLCAFVVLIWPIMALYQSFKASKYGVWVVWLLLIAAVAIGHSQSAQLALLLSFLSFFIYGMTGRLFLWVVMSMIVFYSIAFPWIWPEIYYGFLVDMDFYSKSSLRPQDLGFPFQRFELWTLISEEIQKRPYFGYGAEATKDMVFSGEKKFLHNESFLHPHNMTVQIWAEFGALGIILLLTAIKVALNSIKFIPHTYQPHAVSGFVAVYCMANMSYGIWQSWFVGTIFASLILFSLLVTIRQPQTDATATENTFRKTANDN